MKNKILLLVFFALLMTSCLTTSVNSIFYEKDIISSDAIIGKWEIVDDSVFKNFLYVSKTSENRVLLSFHQQKFEDNKVIGIDTVNFIGSLGKVHSVLFLEFKPLPKEIFYPGLMIPTYHFVRVDLQNKTMKWYSIPPNKLKRYLDKGDFKLNATLLEDSKSMLIIDKTKNLQQFLKQALKKKEFFELSSQYVKLD